MNQGGFDLLWIYMALAVITPGLVYTVVLVWLHSRY
jgi:hypothetical protein